MSAQRDTQTREHALIEAIKRWSGNAFIGDDCAILPGGQLVTADTLVEGTHFNLDTIDYESLGWKAVSVNLSDIAAMGGIPRYLVVNITMPASLSRREFALLYRAMVEGARRYRCAIVGGDLTGGRSLSITITVLGEAGDGGVLTRAGALPGQVVVATGDFGASAAGLCALNRPDLAVAIDARRLREKHCRPSPRLAEGRQLAARAGGRGALMDASDGLADALVQICAASGCGMEVDLAAVPVAVDTRALAAAAGVDALEWALYGGEDYELIACVDEAVMAGWESAGRAPLTRIGRVTGGRAVGLINAGERATTLDLGHSFQHWWRGE